MGLPATRPWSAMAASMAGCVCRQHGQGLIEVSASCHGAEGSARTAEGLGSGQRPTKKPFSPSRIEGRAGESLARQQGGEHAGFGGPRRVQMLAHGPGGEELPQPARLRAGIAQRPDRALVVEREKVRCRHGRAEGPARRRVVPDAIVGLADGIADAAGGLVAVEDGSEEGAAVGVARLGERRRGRDDHRPRMGDGTAVKVVELEDVGEPAEMECLAAGVAGAPRGDRRDGPRRHRIACADGAGERVDDEKRRPFQVVLTDGS